MVPVVNLEIENTMARAIYMYACLYTCILDNPSHLFSVLLRTVEDEQAVGAAFCLNMDDLLKESDFVMLVVNLTPATTGLISHRELSLMKPTATLVNVSRGEGHVEKKKKS